MTKLTGFMLAATWAGPVITSALAGTFTDPAAFNAAIRGTTISTLTFDGLSTGTLIPPGTNLGGITFTYDLGGRQMAVASNFDTTSGANSLGVDDPPNFNQFVAGDSFTLRFAPARAIGFYVITTPDAIFANDIQLAAGDPQVGNAANPSLTLQDGGKAFFLGIVADPGAPNLTLAQLGFNPQAEGSFLYNVDDITLASVPEPSTADLVATALSLVLLAVTSSRNRIKSRR